MNKGLQSEELTKGLTLETSSYSCQYFNPNHKLAAYKDLQIEVTQMWKLQTTIVLVFIGAPGIITKRHR